MELQLSRYYSPKWQGYLNGKNVTYVGSDLLSAFFEQPPSEDSIVEGDLGGIVDRENIDKFEIFDLDLEVVGDHVDGSEVVEVAASHSAGKGAKTVWALYLHKQYKRINTSEHLYPIVSLF